jgi:hypothetical protein
LLKFLYTLSIALLILGFVVFGTFAIPTPEALSVPPELQNVGENPTPEQQDLLAEQGQQQEDFQQRISVYNGVITFVIIGVAVAFLVSSILWLRGMVIIGDAVTLGAVFILLYGLYYAYSIGGGLMSFIAVTLGLVVLITLVYWRFVRSTGVSGWNSEGGTQPTSERAQSDPVGIGGNKGTAS